MFDEAVKRGIIQLPQAAPPQETGGLPKLPGHDFIQSIQDEANSVLNVALETPTGKLLTEIAAGMNRPVVELLDRDWET